ncbi:Transcriptional regulator, LysR family protein [Minicystis rosea]|nr:Transcriptional regulator, LysR family protein [Minicystis rosea]
MPDPLETSELLAFSRTVDAKSLSRAAAELGVPRATISRRLARLEERLGARLLRRTTRSLTLTDAGETLYRHARIVLDAVQQAEASIVQGSTLRGDVRISIPPFESPTLNAMLCDFAGKYPDVRLHVHAAARYVDLRKDGYDVALRVGTRLEPGLVARTLMRTEVIAVASRPYLARMGTPRAARDLKKHRLLLGFERGELPESHWPLRSGGKLHVEPSLTSNSPRVLTDAALAGRGIALLPKQPIERLLAGGDLVHVLDRIVGSDVRVAMVHLERELVPPHVRAFLDMMSTWVPDPDEIAFVRRGR